MAELEVLVRAITSYLNTFAFNAASLDRSELPRGFLTLFGNYGSRQVTAFQQAWQAKVLGPWSKWLLPILVAKDRQTGGAAYTKIDEGTAEMWNTKWLVFLASIICAVGGCAPDDLNLESFTSKTSSLSGNNTDVKIQSARDRSFVPTMQWLEGVVNDHILRRLTKKFIFKWVGLFPADEARKQERLMASARWNELRVVDGQEPIEDELLGDAPVNPNFMALYMQSKGLGQQPGAGDEDGPGDGAWGNDPPAFGLPDSERPLGAAGQGGPEKQAGKAEGRARQHERGAAIKAHTPGVRPRLIVEIRELPPVRVEELA